MCVEKNPADLLEYTSRNFSQQCHKITQTRVIDDIGTYLYSSLGNGNVQADGYTISNTCFVITRYQTLLSYHY